MSNEKNPFPHRETEEQQRRREQQERVHELNLPRTPKNDGDNPRPDQPVSDMNDNRASDRREDRSQTGQNPRPDQPLSEMNDNRANDRREDRNHTGQNPRPDQSLSETNDDPTVIV